MPCRIYRPDASLTPLFRLLDDFDTCSRQAPRRRVIPHWQPKFDVRETEQAYELHGELPGISKDNVHIIFADPQTILISGKKERAVTSSAPPASIPEETNASDAITSDSDVKRNSYQATVSEDEEFESISYDAEDAPEENEKAEPKEDQPKQDEKAETVEEKPATNAKWWLTERTVGEFSRSFNFATRVEHEAVTASFKDGILSIVVPKSEKHESRPISIY
ncbi:hypothetical protein G7Z17_g4096 [Cylindrodendrum hubeiense]|uniref:SHSP domain-containing protein n=1 Tax=Cylindrodendrum hubeiense TaxID=595255 RepID=A0A9P5LCY5_9HYPO|nr:hypothetical protein G7Z17_g4096 [Cylindrodendrum hubeiense]